MTAVQALKNLPQCEFMAFQEVWSSSQRDQLKALMAQYFPHSGLIDPAVKKSLGLMSVSKAPILAAEIYPFKVNYDGVKDNLRRLLGIGKGFQASLVQPKNQERLWVVNLHMHHKKQSIRLAQIVELLNWRIRHPHFKLLLVGDFNFTPESLERGLLMQLLHLKDASEVYNKGYKLGACTYCHANPLANGGGGWVLDYVFYSQMKSDTYFLNVAKAQVNLTEFNGVTMSDHYGVRAYFNYSLNRMTYVADDQRRRALMSALEASVSVLTQEGSSLYDETISMLMHNYRVLKNKKIKDPFWKFFILGA